MHHTDVMHASRRCNLRDTLTSCLLKNVLQVYRLPNQASNELEYKQDWEFAIMNNILLLIVVVLRHMQLLLIHIIMLHGPGYSKIKQV